MSMLHTLPPQAQEAIRASLTPADLERYRTMMHGQGQPRPAGPPGPVTQTRPMMPADGARQPPYGQEPYAQHRYGQDPPPEPGRGGRR
jgi:hypothetical protein